jgi:hypothetical protein
MLAPSTGARSEPSLPLAGENDVKDLTTTRMAAVSTDGPVRCVRPPHHAPHGILRAWTEGLVGGALFARDSISHRKATSPQQSGLDPLHGKHEQQDQNRYADYEQHHVTPPVLIRPYVKVDLSLRPFRIACAPDRGAGLTCER